MTTRHEPIDPDRIARIAHGVLDAYERIAEWNKPRSRSGREMPPYEVMISRAVIDLTAKVERVEELADRLEHEAAYEASRGDDWDATCIRAEARRIRRALNGDNA